MWKRLDQYFEDIDTNPLERLLPIPKEKQEERTFLNMEAVNRLAAIAKMLQYCDEKKINVTEFVEDRTYQKVKAKLKQSVVDNNTYKLIYCPSLEEIPYLLSIETEFLGKIIDCLKEDILRGFNSSQIGRA